MTQSKFVAQVVLYEQLFCRAATMLYVCNTSILLAHLTLQRSLKDVHVLCALP